MSECHLVSGCAEFLGCGVEVSVGAAPAYEKGVGILITHYLKLRNAVGDFGNLLLAHVHHVFMVLGIIGDDARVEVFFKTAYAVSETFSAGNCPVAHECLRIARICAPVLLDGVGHEIGLDFGILIVLGYAPCR